MATLKSNLGIISNVDHFAKFQQCLFALNNGALYNRNGKATTQFLVPFGACALVQLQSNLTDAINRKQFGYAERIASDLKDLQGIFSELAITRDVAQYIADNTPYRV